MRLAPILFRHALLVHAVSALVAVLALLAIAWWLPVGRALIELRGLLEHAGAFGPLALLVLYVVVNLALIPGALVMMVAGAVLSPSVALATMSLGTALAAAAGFVVARHVAHGPIERAARRSPRLEALREAMADGGFGMLVLLRMTPVVPYGFSNYVFGLTPVRLGPFVVASWIAMIPTVVLYTLLGHTGGESLVALQSGLELSGDGPFDIVLIALGFALRWVGVLYVARRTRQRLAKKREQGPLVPTQPLVTKKGLPLGPLLSAGGAGVLVAGALVAFLSRDLLVSALAPDPVAMQEHYAEPRWGKTFDHALLDELLAAHVDDEGWVDYAALAQEGERLDRYLAQLAEAPFDELGRDEKLAFLLNAYNACTLRLVLDHWPLSSILEIPYDRRWEGRTWLLGGRSWTLDQIEHEQCRGSFIEPRVHFALSGANVGGPPLWNRAYRGAALEQQFEQRARHVHGRRRWIQISEEELSPGVDLELGLSRIYAWYRGDFMQAAGSPLAYAARYVPRLATALENSETIKPHWLPYDWSLNGIEARKGPGEDHP